MKTIKEWLNELPSPHRGQAFQNAKKGKLPLLCKNVLEALEDAFIWDDTKEGHIYWSEFHSRIKRGLVKMREVDGDLGEAVELLREVKVRLAELEEYELANKVKLFLDKV